LKSSNIVWDDKTLDAWLVDPQRAVPDNQMTFPGIRSPQDRSDLIAFLKQASQPDSRIAQQMRPGGGIIGGIMTSTVANLKKAYSCSPVHTVRSCRYSSGVATADGKPRKL